MGVHAKLHLFKLGEDIIIHGYSENEPKNLADNSVDMVFILPPYADRGKNTYGGYYPMD